MLEIERLNLNREDIFKSSSKTTLDEEEFSEVNAKKSQTNQVFIALWLGNGGYATTLSNTNFSKFDGQ